MSKKLYYLTILSTILSIKANASSQTVSDIGRWGVPLYALGMSVAEPTSEGVNQLFISAIGAQIASEFLKKVTQEKRPDYTPGKRKESFPSGHAVGAFSGAMFIHKRYGLEYAVVPYMIATYTGYQRVDAKRHHVHDVVAGAGLAALFTWAFVSKYDKSNNQISFAMDKDVQKIEYKTTF
ncbi:MAG: phosphatase PAP2 family protein [bacterium]|nr:phosphatase PAP2 family protein [bacterium]